MALLNLVRVLTPTTGTGTLTLGDAVNGFADFVEGGAVDGETYTYALLDGDHREIGRGVYDEPSGTLTRTVLRSISGGVVSTSPLNLTGNAQVFVTPAAEDFADLGGGGGGTSENVTASADTPPTLDLTKDVSFITSDGLGGGAVVLPNGELEDDGRLHKVIFASVAAPGDTVEIQTDDDVRFLDVFGRETAQVSGAAILDYENANITLRWSAFYEVWIVVEDLTGQTYITDISPLLPSIDGISAGNVAQTDGAGSVIWAAGGGSGRTQLTANRVYYVDAATGDDGNDGLSTGTPFATLAKPFNDIISTVDFNGWNIEVRVYDGTYTDEVTIPVTVGQYEAASLKIKSMGDTITLPTIHVPAGARAYFQSFADILPSLDIRDGGLASIDGTEHFGDTYPRTVLTADVNYYFNTGGSALGTGDGLSAENAFSDADIYDKTQSWLKTIDLNGHYVYFNLLDGFSFDNLIIPQIFGATDAYGFTIQSVNYDPNVCGLGNIYVDAGVEVSLYGFAFTSHYSPGAFVNDDAGTGFVLPPIPIPGATAASEFQVLRAIGNPEGETFWDFDNRVYGTHDAPAAWDGVTVPIQSNEVPAGRGKLILNLDTDAVQLVVNIDGTLKSVALT